MLERIYPRRIILPMKMHYGVPAVPIVKKGDIVVVVSSNKIEPSYGTDTLQIRVI